MQPFCVSPTESLLIGLCLGGYLQRKACGLTVHFLDMLESRLQPFVSTFDPSRRFSIASDDIPDDVEWSGESDERWGKSPTHPNTAFGIGSSGPFCVVFDCDRKSLLHRASMFSGEHCVRAPVDGLLYPAVENHNLPQVWLDVRTSFFKAIKAGEVGFNHGATARKIASVYRTVLAIW